MFLDPVFHVRYCPLCTSVAQSCGIHRLSRERVPLATIAVIVLLAVGVHNLQFVTTYPAVPFVNHHYRQAFPAFFASLPWHLPLQRLTASFPTLQLFVPVPCILSQLRMELVQNFCHVENIVQFLHNASHCCSHLNRCRAVTTQDTCHLHASLCKFYTLLCCLFKCCCLWREQIDDFYVPVNLLHRSFPPSFMTTPVRT